ncbi:MAG: FadR family transcriptional regulator [Deltaproteobacteria bacterium]|nr:FadR family transcriptional regulator [Deltaproteobacteria bacterium]
MDTPRAPGPGFVPLKPQRLSEEVHRQLKEAILGGHYTPGDRLPSERELCETFGVGRPVIREALRFLENSGLITVRQGATGGAFVQRIDSSILAHTLEGIVKMDNVSLQELTEARLALEMGAFPLAVRRLGPEDFEALEENMREVEENLDRKIRGKRNLGFHVLLVKASKNPLLLKIAEALFAFMEKLLEQYEYNEQRSRTVLGVHGQIIDLLKANEVDEAARLLEAHIRDSFCLFQAPLKTAETSGELGPGSPRRP